MLTERTENHDAGWRSLGMLITGYACFEFVGLCEGERRRARR
jgi:hypothetical protein